MNAKSLLTSIRRFARRLVMRPYSGMAAVSRLLLRGQAIPEFTWTELSAAERSAVLLGLSTFGAAGSAAAAYIRQYRVGMGYFPQQTGAGWTLLNNLLLVPGADLNSPYSRALIVHEVLHLQQPLLTRLSVHGELLAWQLQYRVFFDATGVHFGEQGDRAFYNPGDPAGSARRAKCWQELSRLDPDSLPDLARAGQLMRDIDPNYGSNLLPLEPIDRAITRNVRKFGSDSANLVARARQGLAKKIAALGQAAARLIGGRPDA